MVRLTGWLIIIIFSIIGLEAMSSVAVWWLSTRPGNQHLAVQIANFHPLWSKKERTGNPIPPHQRRDASNPFMFDARAGYTNRPDSVYSRKILIGPDGFVCNTDQACPPLGRTKPAGEIRIFIFGGSTVAGDGVEWGSETIAARLEARIGEDELFGNRRVRVINAGVGGYFSAQQLSRLLSDVVSYDPDFIIFLDGHNDYRQWQIATSPPPGMAENLKPNWQAYDYTLLTGFNRIQTLGGAVLHTINIANDNYPVLHYSATLAKHLRLAAMTDGGERKGVTMDSRKDEVEKLLTANDRNSIVSYMRNHEAAAGAMRKLGVRSLMCLQPTLGYPRKDVLSKNEAEVFAGIEEPQGSPQIGRYFAEASKQFSRRAADNDDMVRFCDLSGVFQDVADETYVDNCHYSTTGQDLIAAALLEEIRHMVGGTGSSGS